MKYKYLGDKHTDIKYKGQLCTAVKRSDCKCIRGKSKMLVQFGNTKVIVLARLLRKI